MQLLRISHFFQNLEDDANSQPLGQAWLGFLLPALLEWGYLTSHFVRCTQIPVGVKEHLGVWSPQQMAGEAAPKCVPAME